jgi:hypothetical protein
MEEVIQGLFQQDSPCPQLQGLYDLSCTDERPQHNGPYWDGSAGELAKCIHAGQVRHQQVQKKYVRPQLFA